MQVLRTISAARQRDVLAGLDESSLLGRNYVIMVVLSSIIATFGLVQDSPAVIIGAMLIAPLMSPIIAFSLALVLGDLGRAGRALLTLVVGVALAIGISVVFGQAVSTGRFNFLEQLPAEILGRTHPTLFDLAIALAGGAAAAYALARPELSATLPGVAIATALMPPVCTVGIGLLDRLRGCWIPPDPVRNISNNVPQSDDSVGDPPSGRGRSPGDFHAWRSG